MEKEEEGEEGKDELHVLVNVKISLLKRTGR
jgi:hypothetical protein